MSNLLSETRSPKHVFRRLINAALGAFYAVFLLRTYIELSKVWGYLGFWYDPPSQSVTSLSILSVAVLSLLLPAREWTVIDFCKWILHFLLFIPALLIPPQQGNLPTEQLATLSVSIWISAALFILLVRDGAPFKVISLTERAFWQGIFVIWTLGNLAIFAVFGSVMSLAGIEEVYVQRDAAVSTMSGTSILYITGLMSGAINPFILVVGLRKKKPLLIGLGLFGQLVVYATLAGKVVLGSTLLVVATYYSFKNGRILYSRVYGGLIIIASVGPWAAMSRGKSGDLISHLADYIYLRILTLPGVLVGAYSEFFMRFPVTYLSHSIIGRPFSDYPYGDYSVGQVIGLYITPTMGKVNNYNASFIAADGITGFGNLGIPLIFIVVGLWLWLASKLVGPGERALSCAMLAPFIISLADASLFTSILTGGGGAAVLMLYLFRSTESVRREKGG